VGTNKLSLPITAGFQDGTRTCSLSDFNLVPANIRSGVTIFGVKGTASCSGTSSVQSLSSNAFLDKGLTPVSLVAETTTYAGSSLPIGYREVPSILKDDDGFLGANSVSGEFQSVNRSSFVNCGSMQDTVSARIADCAALNGSNATWNGNLSANAGQGTWKLVTRMGPNQEVWQDQRTGLLWSSIVRSGDNWCRASGNAEAGDPNGYCNGSALQPSYPVAQSWCAESGPTIMKEVTGSGESWASGVYHAAKGGMGAMATPASPSIHWRLPNRNDYELAEINGIRFVLPDMIGSGGNREWTAMTFAGNLSLAWLYSSSNGQLGSASRANKYAVRCVGR
jgi:hypothetical protein